MSTSQQKYQEFYRNTIIAVMVILVLILILWWLKNPPEQPTKTNESPIQQDQVLTTESITIPNVIFTEESQARGINFKHNNAAVGDKWLPEAMGSGIAVIDIENDGDLDLFLTNGTSWDKQNPTRGRLYINDGNAHFNDQTETSGLDVSMHGTGVAVGDTNQDGLSDLFVAAVGRNQLFVNLGNGQFEHSSEALDCGSSDWTSSAGFFDYDGDGDDDLLVLNYIQWTPDIDTQVNYQIEGIGKAYGPPTNFPGTQLCLFNNQSGSFIDVTTVSGISNAELTTKSKALGLVFWDLNDDNKLDFVVANDTVANQAFINQGNGEFTEIGGQSGIGFDAAGKSTGAMGIDIAHYQNDQRLAIAMGNFGSEATSFYVSRSGLFFTDESMLSGIGAATRPVVTFGVFFFDYDLDGRLDYFQTNGHVENLIQQVESGVSYKQPNQLFWNCGAACQPVLKPVAFAGDMLQQELVGRAAAYADFDKDGDLDVIVNQVGGPVKLYINQLENKHQWLTLNLSTADNRSLIGAEINISSKQGQQRRIFSQTKSYQTQTQPWITIGFGNNLNQPVEIQIKELNGQEHQRQFNAFNQIINWRM